MSSPNDSAPSASAVSSSEEAVFLASHVARPAPTMGASSSNDGVVATVRPRVDPPPTIFTSGQPVPTLPNGEVIDAKNTLQSLSVVPSVGRTSSGEIPLNSAKATAPSSQPRTQFLPSLPAKNVTLPNGQVIDGKNTLQSFDNLAIPGRVSANNIAELPVGDRLPASPTTTAVAVAVPEDTEPNIVYAELAPLEPSVWYKGRSICILLTILVIVLTTGLGVYIGTTVTDKNASGADSVNTTPESPLAPTMTSPTPTSSIPMAIASPIATTATSPTARTGAPVKMPMASPITDSPTANPTNEDTSAPSLPPETLQMEVLTTYINNITLSNQNITASGTSPESQALAWMIANDTTLNTSALAAVSRQDGALSSSTIGFSIRQRYALLTMWFQQNEALKWTRTDNWLTDPDECNWYGISCDNVMDTGIAVNAVTSVQINGTRSYVGIFPADIGLLSNLRRFEIRDTYNFDSGTAYVIGTLPDSIGQWTALTHFDVSKNGRLNGTLPDSIGQWTDLTHFDVSINGLTGTLPDGIGQWTALTYFDVNYNLELTGPLPDSIGQWTDLTYFDVSYSALNGPLPDSIGQWTALTYFNVRGSRLSGTIPVSIGNWSLIKYADFSGNQFVGTLPDAICKYIDPDNDFLQVDCTVNCTCCTYCL